MATILVVDDEPANLDLMKIVLGYQKHQVLVAQNGAEGLTLAAKAHPDLLIADILMPSMDGRELARRMRADPALSAVPILFWTALHLEEESRAVAQQTGAIGVLQKPVEPEEILRAITAVLQGQRYFPQETPENYSQEAERNRLLRRLNQLTAAIRRISEEQEIANIVEATCGEARESVGASLGLVVILAEDGQVEEHCFFGEDIGVDHDWSTALVRNLSVEREISRKEAIRLDAGGLGKFVWRSRTNSPIRSLLAIPIRTLTVEYGWLCLMNKIGFETFSPEDQRVCSSLAAHAALRYETAKLESEVRSLNARLVDQIAKLSQANEDLQQVNFALSHDLKEPLRTASAYADLLSIRYGKSDAALRELVGFVHGGIGRMRTMIEGLSQFYRAGMGAENSRAATDSAEVLREVIENCAAAIAECNATVTVDPTPPAGIARASLLHIFQNLVSNSLKYRRSDVAPRIRIGSRIGEGRIEFFVSDNGIGVAPEQREKIFGLFQRLHGDEYPGLGLGLAICARLVRSRGGRIWVEASEEGGAVFKFTLPEAQAAAHS